MGEHDEAELALGQARGDLHPRVAGVIRAEDAPVVLHIQARRIRAVDREAMHALVELRILLSLRQEVRSDPSVCWLPLGQPISGAVDPAGGHGQHRGPVRPAMDVVYGRAAGPGTPLGAVRVVPQAAHQRKGGTAVIGSPQGVRLATRPDDGGVEGIRLDRPHSLDGRARIRREGDGRRFLLTPCRAQVV